MVGVISAWDTGFQPPRMPKYTPRRYSVGVDLGQAQDHTAIAVLEKTVVPPQTALFAPVGKEPSNRLVEGDIVYDLVYLRRALLYGDGKCSEEALQSCGSSARGIIYLFRATRLASDGREGLG